MKNRLFYGDSLDILRRYVTDESVDLVYLDPPFNSQASYNVLFNQKDGTKAASQLHAFHDFWEWDAESAKTFEAVVEAGSDLSLALQAFRQFLGTTDMLAYLTMMAPRLVELRRVLKPTGSIYLHCDPTASHYLKILMDAIFRPSNFKNDITWKRTTPKSDFRQGSTNWPRVHDVLLYYVKDDSNDTTFHQGFGAYEAQYVEEKYRQRDKDGRRYQLTSLIAPGAGTRGHPKYEFMGVTRYWRYNEQKMKALFAEGRIVQPAPGRVPRYKRFLDEMSGVPIGDTWEDIAPVNSQAKERLGYQTQKPEALLDRIIESSTNPGDVVLDPFCGCGTTIASAQRLGRDWIGIDVAEPAIQVIKNRFLTRFNIELGPATGEPESAADAAELARDDPYQFQWWALGLVAARPTDEKKGADKGIDGRRYFHDPTTGKTEQIIFSVKAGHVTIDHVRVLDQVVTRLGAAQGVLISMEEPTKPMRLEAVSAGIAITSWGNFPKIQLVTVAELLAGKALQTPPARQLDVTYPKAPKVPPKSTMPTKQPDLIGVSEPAASANAKRRMKKAGLPENNRPARKRA